MVAKRNFKVTKTCQLCGALFHPWHGRPGKTCSRLCANRLAGREGKEKIGASQRGRGSGKSYRKFMGQHEHRKVASEAIGRLLLPGEVVHHLDGNKLNNNPSNLQVLPSQAEHARIESIHHTVSEEGKKRISAAKRQWWVRHKQQQGLSRTLEDR